MDCLIDWLVYFLIALHCSCWFCQEVVCCWWCLHSVKYLVGNYIFCLWMNMRSISIHYIEGRRGRGWIFPSSFFWRGEGGVRESFSASRDKAKLFLLCFSARQVDCNISMHTLVLKLRFFKKQLYNGGVILNIYKMFYTNNKVWF